MRKTKLFAFLVLLLFISASLTSCSGLFYNNESVYQKNSEEQVYDAIIVPGVPFEDSNWSYIMKGRVIWSAYLYHKGIAKNIIYSGSAVYTPYIEAKIMALYAEKLGIKPEHIFIESKAEHSTENVYYGAMMAKKMGFNKVGLATDKFQSRMLTSFLSKAKRKTGVEIALLPMQYELMQTMPHADPLIDYQLAKTDHFVSIVERESKLKRFRGTLGYNINYEEDFTAEEKRIEVVPTN